ncbi:unnamed protein product [Cochlearia groenlandica]
MACVDCNKKVEPYPDGIIDDNGKPLFSCEKCDDVTNVDGRYYLVLRVSDDPLTEIKFLLFDPVAHKLNLSTVDELYAHYEEVV